MKNGDKPYLTVSYHDPEKRLNISVVADRILFEGDPRYGGTLTLMSVLGPHSAVRGILAAAASYRHIRCDAYPQGRLMGVESGKLITRSLSKEVTHGVYLSPTVFLSALERIAVIDATPEKVYERLTHSFAFPAIPEWAGWLYKKLETRAELTPLAGTGTHGVVIETSEERLDELISEGVREGALRF